MFFISLAMREYPLGRQLKHVTGVNQDFAGELLGA